MDAKTLNAVVHDREAAFYDERFAIAFDGRIGAAVRRDLSRVLGKQPSAKRALDLCCGTGYAGIGLASSGIAAEVHGCDLSIKMLEAASANAARVGVHVSWALCDGERLPYEDGTFDLVVARGALHHLPDPVAALREVRRVLTIGGTAVVLAEPTPNGERQVAAVVGNLARMVEAVRKVARRPVDEAHHNWELASMAANLHTFTPGDLRDMAKDAGFDHARASTAAWAWVLVLGLNYYLAGESKLVEKNGLAKLVRYALVEGASIADRAFVERLVPQAWRHTVQAVLR